jgi:uncharacterized membrane protein YgcG
MRYFKYFFILFISLFLPLNIGVLHAQTEDRISPSEELMLTKEHIESYDTVVRVDRSGKLTITETIRYNFGSATNKHGIFRTIPITYKGAYESLYKIHPRLISVTDGQGNAYTTKTSHSNGTWEIKIGDADVIVAGVKTYIITYTIEGAVSFSPEGNADQDEIYWNAIGTQWLVPIKKASARVELPETISSGLKIACYIGPQDSKMPCEYTSANQKDISFIAPRALSLNEGLAVVVGMPKGILHEPTRGQKAVQFMRDNWPAALPLPVLAVMLLIWSKYGHDPKGRGVIVAEFEAPENMSPIEVGAMIDQQIQGRDVSSLIIDLAVRGYLKVKETGGAWSKDYELIKVREADGALRNYEQTFFKALFDGRKSVTLSSLKTTFYDTAEEVKQQVYNGLVSKKYFASHPETARIWCIVVGIVVGFGGVMMPLYLGTAFTAWSMAGPIIAGVIIAGFGFIMPKMTKEGVMIKEHIKGFKLFLAVTEKERLKFHNAPEKKPELFEKFLPYAMVLKVEGEWAKQFEGIYTKPPEWYSGDWKTFSAVYFSSRLQSFSSVAQSSLVTAPSKSSGFSGGGSGGGFGGGGGGSW